MFSHVIKIFNLKLAQLLCRLINKFKMFIKTNAFNYRFKPILLTSTWLCLQKSMTWLCFTLVKLVCLALTCLFSDVYTETLICTYLMTHWSENIGKPLGLCRLFGMWIIDGTKTDLVILFSCVLLIIFPFMCFFTFIWMFSSMFYSSVKTLFIRHILI